MQFDVFRNPLVRARNVLPYVVVLQADASHVGNDRIIAFLTARENVGKISGRLMPIVDVQRTAFVVLMPSPTNIPVSELRRPIDNIAAYRNQIVEAIDRLFLGI